MEDVGESRLVSEINEAPTEKRNRGGSFCIATGCSNEFYRVGSDHFIPSNYIVEGAFEEDGRFVQRTTNRLKPDAVPSVYDFSGYSAGETDRPAQAAQSASAPHLRDRAQRRASCTAKEREIKMRMKENSPRCTPTPILRKKRQVACRQCVACLREDCGKCIYCLDKKKFGGPEKKRQKCRFRVCLVMLNLTLGSSHFTPSILSDSTLTLNSLSGLLPQEGSVHHMSTGLTYIPPPAAAPPFLHPLLLQPKEEEESVDIDEYGRAGGKGGQREDGGMMEEEAAARRMKEEEEAAAGRMKEEEVAAGQMKEEEEAAGRMKEGAAAGRMKEEEEAAGRMKEEEVAAGRMKEEEEAAGQMKEEEEAAGWMKEEKEEECSVGVTEEGKYYEIEVEVPGLDSDEETLTESSTLSEITEVTNDVTAKVTDEVTAHDPPEHISLSSGSFSLLGGKVGDEVTCGRGLSQLLQELRQTVLPAHWVAVLADGPLLQCSRLSSMLTTIIHIQPDLFFFITVQNQLLPDTHTLYHTYTQRITHLSQLVSLLLELEGLVVCRGSRVRSCHLLVAPPCLTCLPCLLGEEGEDEEEEEEDEEEEEVEQDISDSQTELTISVY